MTVLAGQLGPLASLSRRLGGAAFSPLDVSPALWVDASAITGLSDNDPVASWEDLSGSGPDLIQGTAGAQPTYKTGAMNSLPVVRFDGGDGLAVSPSPLSVTQPFAFAFVLNPDVTGGLGFLFDSAASNRGYVYRGGGTPYWALGKSGEVYGTGTPVAPMLLCFVPNGASTAIFYNGSSYATGSITGGDFDIQWFGRRASAANTFFKGDIAEMVLWENPTTENRQEVEGYLAHKWGITAKLPSNHPYKTEAP